MTLLNASLWTVQLAIPTQGIFQTNLYLGFPIGSLTTRCRLTYSRISEKHGPNWSKKGIQSLSSLKIPSGKRNIYSET